MFKTILLNYSVLVEAWSLANLGVWKPQALQVSWKRQGLGALVATAADPSGNPDRLLVFTDSTSNNIIKTTCRLPISSRYHWLDPEKLEAARKEFAEMEA